MKVAFVKSPFRIEIRDLEIPQPGINEVLCKVKTCGICGFDVILSSHRAKRWQKFGHEIVAEVTSWGKGVKNLTKGELVIVENSTYCGVCRNCKNGDVLHCKNWLPFEASGFAEYQLANKQAIYPIGNLSPFEAVLSEPLTVALDLVRVSDIKIGEEVAVLGAGPIGLMTTKLCKLRGAKRIYLGDVSESSYRLDMGKKMGADVTIEADKDDLVKKIKKLTKERGVEHILITAPPQKVLDQALEIASFGGIISFIGISTKSEESIVSMDIEKLHFKKLQLRASNAVPNLLFPVALDLIKNKSIDTSKLITHSFSLEELEKALKLASEKKDKIIKAIITF